MKKTFVCVTYILLIVVFACGPVSVTSATCPSGQNVNDTTGLTRQDSPAEIAYKQKKYDAISVKDLFFFNGSKSIEVLSITPSKLKEAPWQTKEN